MIVGLFVFGWDEGSKGGWIGLFVRENIGIDYFK